MALATSVTILNLFTFSAVAVGSLRLFEHLRSALDALPGKMPFRIVQPLHSMSGGLGEPRGEAFSRNSEFLQILMPGHLRWNRIVPSLNFGRVGFARSNLDPICKNYSLEQDQQQKSSHVLEKAGH